MILNRLGHKSFAFGGIAAAILAFILVLSPDQRRLSGEETDSASWAGETRSQPPVPLREASNRRFGRFIPTGWTAETDAAPESGANAASSPSDAGGQTEAAPKRREGEAATESESTVKTEKAEGREIPTGRKFGSSPSDAASVSAVPYRSTETIQTPVGPDEELTITRKTAYPRGMVFYEFSNGLSLFVQRNTAGLATVRAYVRNTGSQNEKEFLGTGISHLTEHLVCGGTTAQRKESETQTILERLGGSFNAFTGKELTGYYIDCLSDDVPTAMDLLADWMRHCAIDPDEFSREKRVILQELADSQNDPRRAASDLLLRTVYRENPYRHPVGGYPDLFAEVTREDVKRFYESRYVPNNILFFVAGDIRPDDAAERLMTLFRGEKRGAESEPAPMTEPAQIAPREAVREMDVEMFRLLLAWPTVALDHSDVFPLDVLAIILAGGESGRLNRKIKNEKQLGFSFDASSMTPATVPGLFLIQAETLPENLEGVQTEILDQIGRLVEVPVTPEELARAKKQAEAAFVYGRETLSAVADSCAFNYLMTGDPDFDRQYLEGIRKVSIGDITRVVRDYFKSERQNRILIAPIGMAPTDVIQSETKTSDAIEAFRIPENDLRILVKKSDALPMVNVQVYCLGSALIDTEANAGRTALLAAMLDKGSRRYSRTDVENYFDSVGGALSFQVGRNTLSAEMTLLKEDYKKGLDILADLLLRPAFPEEEFVKAKKRQLDKIFRRGDSPAEEIFELFSDQLSPATPYHLQIDGKTESVQKLTPEDLRGLHRQMVVPERTIVTVFGDIDVEEAAYAVKEHFAGLPKTKNLVEISFDRKNDLIREPNEHKMTRRGTGLGIIAWPTVSVRDEKDYAALTVLQAILGGYGYPGGRLFRELRGEGLVYRLKVDQMTGPAPGYFYALFETAPDRIGETFDRIEKGIERIKGGDIPEDEFVRAKERIVAFHPRELESLSNHARQGAIDDLYGLGYKNDLGFSRRINDVTRDDVIAAAQKFFSQRVRVSTSPNPTR